MADDEIPLIPKVPESLREAAQRSTLVPFVGAGVSRLAGCPGWAELADQALGSLGQQNSLSYAEIDQLRKLAPRLKLSIAALCQQDGRGNLNLDRLLHPEGWSTNATGLRVYGALSAISRTFVTTNYDRWLDQAFPQPNTLGRARTQAGGAKEAPRAQRTAFYRPGDFTAANLDLLDTVFHLHGSVKEPRGLVIATRHYLRQYANDQRGPENPVLRFLDFLFRNRTVMFVGYGLDELEILEYVVRKSASGRTPGQRSPEVAQGGGPTEQRSPQHFILQGFFSHERELMRSLKRYYEELGVGLLPYSRDEKDWAQLAEVLVYFALQLPQPTGGGPVLRDLIDMERLLNG